MSKRNQPSVVENEAILDKTIEDGLEKTINKIHSGRGKKLNRVREEKLYREKHGTLAEYIKKENGWTREHGQNVAKVARFCELTGKFREQTSSMSHNSQDRFVINHNKRVKSWQIKKAYLPMFTPLLEQIIGITIDSVKNDKVKITREIINVCDNVITDFLNAEKLEFSDNLIEKATKKLKENYEKLVAICKERLMTTAIPKTAEICNHLQEIISIEKNLLTLKCGCVFRLE